jgi:serine/threonine protein kinase
MTVSLSHNGASATAMSCSGSALLEDLIEECTNRLQRGEVVDIEALARDHPGQADRLRRILPSLQMMAEIGHSAVREITGLALPADGTPGLGELGDFRIIREVGRGGMGVVYEAIQVSLNRRVALKVLPFAAAMDPTQLRRFQTEALAAAQLHHTNIVPVYSVGCERGVHYYAMQFIEGQTLAALIGECRGMEQGWHRLPACDSGGHGQDARASPGARATSIAPIRGRGYFRTVAELGIQAAEALDYAHKVGIIHRDIKPANLLLDESGKLWITDFGLARFQEDSGLTMTGDLLGTLRYMSPEQALAKRGYLDHRTDIYSLAVTLYELLTLRPAIEGTDRQELLRRIAQDEPTPPRKHNPAIPRELETILLKAMSKEPEWRYATAKDLVDDLRRFLDDKPITARRPSFMELAAKWSRRHATLVASAVIVLLLTLLAVASGTFLLAREHARTRTALHEARLQQYRAQQNFHHAVNGVARVIAPLSDESIERVAAVVELRRRMFDRAGDFYRNLRNSSPTDPWLRHEAIDATLHLAGLYASLAQDESLAEKVYREAITLSGRLVADYPDQAAHHNQNGQTHNILGGFLGQLGRRDEAAEEFACAASSYDHAWVLDPHSLDSLIYSASFLVMCPVAQLRNPARAARLAREGIAQDQRYASYNQWINLGIALYRLGDCDGAIHALEHSASLRSGGDSFEWFVLAMAHSQLGHREAARRWHERAIRWMGGYRPTDSDLHILEVESAVLLGEAELPPDVFAWP